MTSRHSERGRLRRVLVLGESAAALLTTVRLCEMGVPVRLLTTGALRRPVLVGAAVLRAGATAPDTDAHAAAIASSGGPLVDQRAVAAMTALAPRLVDYLDRAGVAFERTAEGRVARRAATTPPGPPVVQSVEPAGRAVARVLAEQVARWAGEPAVDGAGERIVGQRQVEVLEGWDLVDLVRDDGGVVVGVVAQDVNTGRFRGFPGDAVCLGGHGFGQLFAPRSGTTLACGGDLAIAMKVGAIAAGLEQLRPAPAPGAAGSRGGLWVDVTTTAPSPQVQATSLSGLYAVGAAAASPLASAATLDDDLLADLVSGWQAGPAIASYQARLERSAFDLPSSLFDKRQGAAEKAHEGRLSEKAVDDGPNAFALHRELAAAAAAAASLDGDDLDALDEALERIAGHRNVAPGDRSERRNVAALQHRHLDHLLAAGRAFVAAARQRADGAEGDATWLRLDDDGAPRSVDTIEGYCAGEPFVVTRDPPTKGERS